MEELLEILNELHPDVDFTTATGLVDNRILDSFDIVTLVSEIVDAYDVEISAEELIPDNFNSAQAIYDLIQSKIDEDY